MIPVVATPTQSDLSEDPGLDKDALPGLAWKEAEKKNEKMSRNKNVMQGKLFQKCTQLLYCSVLSLGTTVNKA